MSDEFLDSEGIGNLLVKLGVALGALINPNTAISKQIKALDTNNDGIITKAEIPNDYKSIVDMNNRASITPTLLQLKLAKKIITDQIAKLETQDNTDKDAYDRRVENKIKTLRKNIKPFKTKNIMFDHEKGSTASSVVLTFVNPADHTIGDLLGNSQNEIYEIKKIYREAYPECRMCRYRFAYINDFDYDSEIPNMMNQMYDSLFNFRLSNTKLVNTVIKFSDELPIPDLDKQIQLQEANLVAKLYVIGSYGNTNIPRYIDYMLGTKAKDIQYKAYFSNWFIYEKVKSIDNVFKLRLSADTNDISTKLTDNTFKLKMLDDLSLVYIKAIELTGIAFTDLHTGNFGYDSNGQLKLIDYDHRMEWSPWPLNKLRNFSDFSKNYDEFVKFLSTSLENTIKTDIMYRYIYECYMDQHKDMTYFGRDAYLLGESVSDLSYSRFLTTNRASELGVTDRKVLPMAQKSILLGRAIKNLFGNNPSKKELLQAKQVWDNYDAFNSESDYLESLVNNKAVHVPTLDSISVKQPQLIGYCAMQQQLLKF